MTPTPDTAINGSGPVQEMIRPFTKTQELHTATFAVGRDFVSALLIELLQPVIHANPVALVVRIKAAQDLLESWRRGLCEIANGEFLRVTQSLPGVHSWQIDDLAVLSKYTPAATWKYPADVLSLISIAESAKAKAKAEHTATAVTPAVDTKTTFLFKTSILCKTADESDASPAAPAAPAAQV